MNNLQYAIDKIEQIVDMEESIADNLENINCLAAWKSVKEEADRYRGIVKHLSLTVEKEKNRWNV